MSSTDVTRLYSFSEAVFTPYSKKKFNNEKGICNNGNGCSSHSNDGTTTCHHI